MQPSDGGREVKPLLKWRGVDACGGFNGSSAAECHRCGCMRLAIASLPPGPATAAATLAHADAATLRRFPAAELVAVMRRRGAAIPSGFEDVATLATLVDIGTVREPPAASAAPPLCAHSRMEDHYSPAAAVSVHLLAAQAALAALVNAPQPQASPRRPSPTRAPAAPVTAPGRFLPGPYVGPRSGMIYKRHGLRGQGYYGGEATLAAPAAPVTWHEDEDGAICID
jgi:hypothetical protein